MQIKTSAICSENEQLKERLAAMERERSELREKLKAAEGIFSLSARLDFFSDPSLISCFLLRGLGERA